MVVEPTADTLRALVAAERGERLRAPAPATAVVDTVSAGNAFQAALLCALGEARALNATALAALPAAWLEQALLCCVGRLAERPRQRKATYPVLTTASVRAFSFY